MRYLYTIFALLLLSVSVIAAPVQKDSPFFFIQLADTQIGMDKGNADLSPEINNFEKAVEQINRLKPAFVVISGDLINVKGDLKQIRAFRDAARKINASIPLYLLPGNHDDAPGTASDVNVYVKLFGKNYYSFSCNGSSFIVLDSSVIHYPESDQAIKKTQREWFESELKTAQKSKPNHVFVLTHHPWFIASADEEDSYDNIPLTNRKDYLQLMEKYKVDFAAAGHFHKEAFAKAGGLSMIITGSVGKALGKDPVGFRVFKVYKDKVEDTYYTLDKVPEKIEL